MPELDPFDLFEAVSFLRDEVLETAQHGDRDPPGAAVFEAVLRALAVGGEPSSPGGPLDLALHDAVSRRLAWGDSEETVLADTEAVFDRLVAAVERALRDPAPRIAVIDVATTVAVTVARVVALAAVARASRDRAAKLREELAQRQLQDVLAKQKALIDQLEADLKRDF